MPAHVWRQLYSERRRCVLSQGDRRPFNLSDCESFRTLHEFTDHRTAPQLLTYGSDSGERTAMSAVEGQTSAMADEISAYAGLRC